MDIKKRDNEHGVSVYDLIGLTEGKMLAILHAFEYLVHSHGGITEGLSAVQYDVNLAIKRALERSKP